MKNHRFHLFLVLACIFLSLPAACSCGGDDDDDSTTPVDDTTSDDDTSSDDDTGDDDTLDDTADDDTYPNVSDLIESGKSWLMIGEGDKARLDFMEALEIAPGYPEAMYGLVLSDAVHDMDIVSTLYYYIHAFIEYGGPVKDNPDDLLDNILETVMNGLLFDRSAELVQYAQLCHSVEDIQFLIDVIPIYIEFERVAELGTEFDQAEVYGTEALAELLQGLFHHLTALSVDIDISYGFLIVDITDMGLSTMDMVGAIVNVLIDMLTDESFEDFLTLPPENLDEFRGAGLSLGNAMDAYMKTFAAIRSETDDPSDDVLTYKDSNGDWAWGADEPFILPSYGELTDADMELFNSLLVLAEDLRNSFWDYTDKDIDPTQANPFPLSDLNPILNFLGLPSLIPDLDFTHVDIGSVYVDPGYDGFKQTLLLILNIADLFLPDPVI